MVELDGDEVRVSSRGRYAERDIVQVCFRSSLLISYLPSLLNDVHLPAFLVKTC